MLWAIVNKSIHLIYCWSINEDDLCFFSSSLLENALWQSNILNITSNSLKPIHLIFIFAFLLKRYLIFHQFYLFYSPWFFLLFFFIIFSFNSHTIHNRQMISKSSRNKQNSMEHWIGFALELNKSILLRIENIRCISLRNVKIVRWFCYFPFFVS